MSKSDEIKITNSTGQAYFDFKRALTEITDDILNDANEALNLAKEDAANWAKDELRKDSQAHGWRHYSKGWAVRREKSEKQYRYIVHNATHYQLTHLLEKGHRIVTKTGRDTGKRAPAYPHIAPVNEQVPDKVDEAFKTHLAELYGAQLK
jgi:tRNA U38,U39,U40 pseudouridine synthase TruA